MNRRNRDPNEDLHDLDFKINIIQVQNPTKQEEWIQLSNDDKEAIEFQASQHKKLAVLRNRKLATNLSFLSCSSSSSSSPSSSSMNDDIDKIASSLIFSFDLETGIAVFVTSPRDPIIVTCFRYQGNDGLPRRSGASFISNRSNNNYYSEAFSPWLPDVPRRKESYVLNQRIVELIKLYEKDKRESCLPTYETSHRTFSHCHRCAQKFGFFRWRQSCTGCLYQFCPECSSDGEGINGGILCNNCKLFVDYKSDPLCLEGIRLAAEVFKIQFPVFKALEIMDDQIIKNSSREACRVEHFSKRTYGELEIAYLFDLLINVARLDTCENNNNNNNNNNNGTKIEDYVNLIKHLGNEVWIKDVEQVLRENSSLSGAAAAADQSIGLNNLVISIAHEAGVLLGQPNMVSSPASTSPSAAAAFLMAERERIGKNASNVFAFLNSRMAQGFRLAAKVISSTSDFSKLTKDHSTEIQRERQQAGVVELMDMLTELHNEFYCDVVEKKIDGKVEKREDAEKQEGENKKDGAEEETKKEEEETKITSPIFMTTVAKLAQKLDSIGGAYEQQPLFSSKTGNSSLPMGHWQRELSRSFLTIPEAIECVACVFLYTLEEIPLYQLLNQDVRTKMQSASPFSSSAAMLSQQQNGESNFARKVLNPLRIKIIKFLENMPSYPRLVYRVETGATHRPNLNHTILPQFTSTTTLFNVAHDVFLNGNRTGTFFIFVAFQSVAIGPYSSVETDSEILLPPGLEFEVIHSVPAARLAVMDQRFGVVCLQQKNCPFHVSTHRQQIALAFDAQRAVTNVYKEIQRFFIPPTLTEIIEKPNRNEIPEKSEMLSALNQLLLNETYYYVPDVSSTSLSLSPLRGEGKNNNHNQRYNWLCLCSPASGMGKSSLATFVQSYVNENHLHEYQTIFISLPSLPHHVLFSEENPSSSSFIENYLLRQLTPQSSSTEILNLLLRDSSKILLILDSLDEVDSSSWPKDKPLFPSLHIPNRWPNLRVILTCRCDFLSHHKLSLSTLTAKRGKGFTIESFSSKQVDQLTNVWIPGAGETGEKIRNQIKQHYGNEAMMKSSSTETFCMNSPFNLYLMIKSFGAQLMLRRGHPFPATAQEMVLAAEMQQRRDQRYRESSPTLSAADNENNNICNNAMIREEAIAFTVMTQRWASDKLLSSSSSMENKRTIVPPATLLPSTFGETSADSATLSNLPWRDGDDDVSHNNNICYIYEQGIKCLIAQNAEHHYGDVSDVDMKRIVNDVFEWSQFVALLMFTFNKKCVNNNNSPNDTFSSPNSVWRTFLAEDEEFSNLLFCDESQRWFSDDPTELLMLAPVRLISGNDNCSGASSSSSSCFEFRHRFIQEFLVGYAAAKSSNSRIIQLAREADVMMQYPNVALFYNLLKETNNNNTNSIITLPLILDQQTHRKIKISDFAKFIRSVSRNHNRDVRCLCLHQIYFINDVVQNSNTAGIFDALSLLLLSDDDDSSRNSVTDFFSNQLTHLEITCGKIIQNENTLQIIKVILSILSTARNNNNNSNTTSLEVIIFDHPQLGDEILLPFFSSPAAANLRQITIANSPFVTAKPFEIWKKNNNGKIGQLRVLDFSGCSNVSLASVFSTLFAPTSSPAQLETASFENQNNLRHINISNTWKIFPDSEINVIVKYAKKLRSINMANSTPPPPSPAAGSIAESNTQQKAYFSSCDLRDVNFTGCESRPIVNGSKIFFQNPKLFRFICINNRQALEELFNLNNNNFNHNLTILDISGAGNLIHDDEIGRIAELFPRLMQLKACQAQFCDAGLIALKSRLICGSGEEGQLRVLDISSPERPQERHEDSIIGLLKHQPNLQSLNIAFNNTCTNDVLFSLINNNNKNNDKSPSSISSLILLRSIDVGWINGGISDRGMGVLIKAASNLKKVVISEANRQISDATCLDLASSCFKSLQKIVMINMQGSVTDSGIVAIVTKCKSLKSIIVSDQSKSCITGDSVVAIGKNCSKLEEFDFEWMYPNVSENEILTLIRGCSSLRRLSFGKNVESNSTVWSEKVRTEIKKWLVLLEHEG